MKDRKDTSSDTDPAKPRPGATVRPQEAPSAESCKKGLIKVQEHMSHADSIWGRLSYTVRYKSRTGNLKSRKSHIYYIIFS